MGQSTAPPTSPPLLPPTEEGRVTPSIVVVDGEAKEDKVAMESKSQTKLTVQFQNAALMSSSSSSSNDNLANDGSTSLPPVLMDKVR